MIKILCMFGLLGLAGCATDIRDIGVAPHMTEIGSGLHARTSLPPVIAEEMSPSSPVHSLWEERSVDLFRDARAARIGDLITVIISINDRASFGNSSDRSRESKYSGGFDAAANIPGYTNFKATAGASGRGASSVKGQGNIDRSERLQMSVAAVVTEVYPNGNLLISGSQEVRVNFELRELTVSGIVRARDVNRDNTILYDKVAEARISYGGRGRIMEVQQPTLFHQVLDAVSPF